METIAGGKANGEVHNYSGVVGTDELGFAGLSLRVTWLSIPGVDQGDLGSRCSFHAMFSRRYF